MSTFDAPHDTYSFAGFVLDVDRGALVHSGKDIKLRPKSFAMLRLLVEQHGRLVSKDDILKTVWGKTVVTDDAIAQCLIDIRRAIGDQSQEMVRTIPRRGYIFDIPVELSDGEDATTGTPSRTGFFATKSHWLAPFALIVIVGVVGAWWYVAIREPPIPTAVEPPLAAESYSIAVLPFLNLSSEQELGYFADGISEEVLNHLMQVPELRVIARTSSFAFRGQAVNIATIREQLGVTHVLEGSVRQSGDTVRITAQLVDASSSEHVWSQTYERSLNDIFAIQDEISTEVLKHLTNSLAIPIRSTHEPDPEAYRLYLQAVHMLDRLDFSKNAEILPLLQRAVQLDPEFAPAWRELGRVRWREIGDGPDVRDNIKAARVTLDRALALTPDNAATLAYSAWHAVDFDGDAVKAARLFERAISMEPGNENVIRTAVLFALGFGRENDTIALGEFGVARNPLCYPCYIQLSNAYRNAGRLDEAEDVLRSVKSLFDRNSGGALGVIQLLDGRPDEALESFGEEPMEWYRLFGTALALYDLGRTEESNAVFEQFLGSSTDEPWWHFAQAYAWTGQADAAFAAIERATERDQVHVDGETVRWRLILISRQSRSMLFRPLHSDPRWQEFLEKYGISQDQLADVDFRVPVLQ